MAGLPDRGIRGSLEDAQDGPRTCRSTQSAGGGADAAGGRPRVGVGAGHGPQVRGSGGPSAEIGGRASAPAGLGRGRRAGAGAAGRIGAMDRRQTAAHRHATARAVAGRGAPRRRDRRQRRGRGMEAAAPRGLRAADVSAGRSRRGRLLRSAGRRRRDAPQGLAVPDAADVLGPRLRVDLRAPGSNQLSRRARPRVCALRGRAGPRRVR